MRFNLKTIVISISVGVVCLGLFNSLEIEQGNVWIRVLPFLIPAMISFAFGSFMSSLPRTRTIISIKYEDNEGVEDLFIKNYEVLENGIKFEKRNGEIITWIGKYKLTEKEVEIKK
jgi:hypothetical protein